MPPTVRRSDCPINVSLEILGDRWSLLVVRDLLFKGRNTFQDFLSGSEHIASNVLADRLSRLHHHGVIEGERDANDGRRINYRLTQKGLALAPVLVEMMIWIAQFEITAAPDAEIKAMRRNRAGYIKQATRTAALSAAPSAHGPRGIPKAKRHSK